MQGFSVDSIGEPELEERWEMVEGAAQLYNFRDSRDLAGPAAPQSAWTTSARRARHCGNVSCTTPAPRLHAATPALMLRVTAGCRILSEALSCSHKRDAIAMSTLLLASRTALSDLGNLSIMSSSKWRDEEPAAVHARFLKDP